MKEGSRASPPSERHPARRPRRPQDRGPPRDRDRPRREDPCRPRADLLAKVVKCSYCRKKGRKA
eukprot:5660946-Pyramimonas_sp.AAC.1